MSGCSPTGLLWGIPAWTGRAGRDGKECLIPTPRGRAVLPWAMLGYQSIPLSIPWELGYGGVCLQALARPTPCWSLSPLSR